MFRNKNVVEPSEMGPAVWRKPLPDFFFLPIFFPLPETSLPCDCSPRSSPARHTSLRPPLIRTQTHHFLFLSLSIFVFPPLIEIKIASHHRLTPIARALPFSPHSPSSHFKPQIS